ncbi:Hypothetical Protein OBI_RACECAR_278 [Arthrobacter phage Racecar]|nr:hypothetical protein PBI_RACECAR_70 [Arthrobacter phage Racecar]
MPRKKPYEKKKIPFVEVLPKLDYDDSWEALRRDAARMTNEMIGWKNDQWDNNPDGTDMREEYVESGFFNLVERAKRYSDNIYTRNRTLPDAEFQTEQARLQGNQEEFDKWTKKSQEIEAEVVGLWWKIYKIYCQLKASVTFRTKREIRGVDEHGNVIDDGGDLIVEWEQDPDDLEKMGGV